MGRTIIAGRSFTLNNGAVSSRYDTSNTSDSSTNTDSSAKSDNSKTHTTGEEDIVKYTKAAVAEAISNSTDEKGNTNWKKVSDLLSIKDRLDYNSTPKNLVTETLADWGYKLHTDEDGNLTVSTEEASDNISTAGIFGGGLLGTIAINKGSKVFNKKKVPVKEEDLKEDKNYTKNEDGSYSDKDGNKLTIDEKGRVVGEDGDVLMKNNPNNDGIVVKGIKGIKRATWETGKELISKSTNNPTNNPTDETENSSSNKQDTDSTDSTDNDSSQHKDSSNNNDKTIIPQNEDVGKDNAQNRINKAIDNSRNKNAKAFENGDISESDFKKKEMRLDQLEASLDNGNVSFNSLYKADIKPADLDLMMNEKGNVDFEKTNSSIERAKQLKQNKLTGTDKPTATSSELEAQERWINEKQKSLDPESPTDVDEYVENNNGAKSRVNYSPSGREPSEPKYPVNAPQSAAPTQSTQNIKNPETNADPITDSSNNNDKTIISQNEDAGNSL